MEREPEIEIGDPTFYMVIFVLVSHHLYLSSSSLSLRDHLWALFQKHTLVAVLSLRPLSFYFSACGFIYIYLMFNNRGCSYLSSCSGYHAMSVTALRSFACKVYTAYWAISPAQNHAILIYSYIYFLIILSWWENKSQRRK